QGTADEHETPPRTLCHFSFDKCNGLNARWRQRRTDMVLTHSEPREVGTEFLSLVGLRRGIEAVQINDERRGGTHDLRPARASSSFRCTPWKPPLDMTRTWSPVVEYEATADTRAPRSS